MFITRDGELQQIPIYELDDQIQTIFGLSERHHKDWSWSLGALLKPPWTILDKVEFLKFQDDWWKHRTRDIVYTIVWSWMMKGSPNHWEIGLKLMFWFNLFELLVDVYWLGFICWVLFNYCWLFYLVSYKPNCLF